MHLRERLRASTRKSCSGEVRRVHSVRIGKIYGINGPVIYLKGKTDFQMSEMVMWEMKSWWVK